MIVRFQTYTSVAILQNAASLCHRLCRDGRRLDQPLQRSLPEEGHGELCLNDAIKYAREPKDLWVSLGICFDENHFFYAEGFGHRRMTIKQILYRTDALQQIANFIGRDIKLRPIFQNSTIFIRVEYWPRHAPAQINNPEDE